jgi:hypothetical protein
MSFDISVKKPRAGKWIKITFFGWFLGVFLIILLSSALGSMGIDDKQFYLGTGMGAGIGFSQWWFLRKQLNFSMKWMWIAALGMGAPFFIFDLIQIDSHILKVSTSIAVGSIAVGFLQSNMLNVHFTKTKAWIVSSFFGWTVAVLFVFSIDYTKHIQSDFTRSIPWWNLVLALINLILILSGGIVLGLVQSFSWRTMRPRA